jgi:hypothetical protein
MTTQRSEKMTEEPVLDGLNRMLVEEPATYEGMARREDSWEGFYFWTQRLIDEHARLTEEKLTQAIIESNAKELVNKRREQNDVR